MAHGVQIAALHTPGLKQFLCCNEALQYCRVYYRFIPCPFRLFSPYRHHQRSTKPLTCPKRRACRTSKLSLWQIDHWRWIRPFTMARSPRRSPRRYSRSPESPLSNCGEYCLANQQATLTFFWHLSFFLCVWWVVSLSPDALLFHFDLSIRSWIIDSSSVDH